MASPVAARTVTLGGPDPDRQALRLGAGSRCGSGPTAGSRLRGSASENRHGGAPRGVPVAPGQGGRASQARPKKECACRRSIHPSISGREGRVCCCRDRRWRSSPLGLASRSESKRKREEDDKPGRSNAPRERTTALFDIVNRNLTINGSHASRGQACVPRCMNLLHTVPRHLTQRPVEWRGRDRLRAAAAPLQRGYSPWPMLDW